MKKVLQIIPDLNVAGAETMLENLSNSLDKNKYEVIIISFFDTHTIITDRLESKGFKVIYLNKKRGFDISLYKKLGKLFKKEKPDVIHTHRHTLLYTVLPAKIHTKAKLIHTIHNIASKEVPKYSIWLQRIFFKYMKVVPIAISLKIQDTICEQYNLKREKVPVIFNAIDLEKCIKKEGYESNNVVLHIGRFSNQKNHSELIDIWNEVSKKYPKYILNLIGQGELENEVKQKVKELNLTDKVKFCGIKETCYEDLNKCDIFVLPSKYEGFPMSLIEAMGTGVPCVSYNVGGVSELLENEKEGYAVENKEEFIEKLETLLESTELREEIGKNALEKSKKYSAVSMAKEYQKIYEA